MRINSTPAPVPHDRLHAFLVRLAGRAGLAQGECLARDHHVRLLLNLELVSSICVNGGFDDVTYDLPTPLDHHNLHLRADRDLRADRGLRAGRGFLRGLPLRDLHFRGLRGLRGLLCDLLRGLLPGPLHPSRAHLLRGDRVNRAHGHILLDPLHPSIPHLHHHVGHDRVRFRHILHRHLHVDPSHHDLPLVRANLVESHGRHLGYAP